MTLASDKTADGLTVGAVIRRLRKAQRWSTHRLAEEAGISAASVHKIERGQMVPTITLLLKVARALRKSVGELLEQHAGDREQTNWSIIRGNERHELRFPEFPLVLQRLVGNVVDRHLEAGVYHVEPGGSPAPAPLTHPGEKLYVLLSGKLRFEVAGRFHTLEKGDTLHLNAETVPHRWENTGESAAELLFVVTPPHF